MQLAGNAFNGGVVSACLIACMTVMPWDDVHVPPDMSDVSEDLEGEESEEASAGEFSPVESGGTPETD